MVKTSPPPSFKTGVQLPLGGLHLVRRQQHDMGAEADAQKCRSQQVASLLGLLEECGQATRELGYFPKEEERYQAKQLGQEDLPVDSSTAIPQNLLSVREKDA